MTQERAWGGQAFSKEGKRGVNVLQRLDNKKGRIIADRVKKFVETSYPGEISDLV